MNIVVCMKSTSSLLVALFGSMLYLYLLANAAHSSSVHAMVCSSKRGCVFGFCEFVIMGCGFMVLCLCLGVMALQSS